MVIAPCRRQFHNAALAVLLSGEGGFAAAPPQRNGAIRSIEHRGVLIRDCSLPGERRADDVVPAHPNGIQLSRDRWLLIYATRGFRGVDDDRSIVYQLRRNSPDGRVIKEGFFARSIDDWDPFSEGKAYVKQHGHPVAFGVPKGATIEGKPAVNANLFAAAWRVTARILDPQNKGALLHGAKSEEIGRRTQAVEWLQFRLNEREDDLEVVQPAKVLRQKGHQKGRAFCEHEALLWMNQTFTPPVAADTASTRWACCNHFDGGRVAALEFAFDPKAKRYEWTKTGPLLGEPKRPLSEASLVRLDDGWLIAARGGGGKGGSAWVRTDDPFGRLPKPTYPNSPLLSGPLPVFRCGDGVVRLFGGDPTVSPRRNARDPLYCWDVDPRDFSCAGRRVLFDSVKAGLKIRSAAVPKIDMGKLLPPQGRTQLFAHRVSVRSYNRPYVGGSGKATNIPAIDRDEKACCAIYYARLTYEGEAPSWEFA